MEFIDNKPIYLQLADQIMDGVERGEYKPDERLLSVREYASNSGVNANTVMRTYTWLQQENIIYNKRGIGYFLEEDACEKVITNRRRQFFEKELPRLIDRMKALGVTIEEVREMYESRDEKDNK